MHNAALRCIKRLHGAKQILSSQTDTRPYGVNLLITRGRFHITMLDEEKICEMEIAHSDLNSLSWLHTVAPTFPINGSKITIIQEPGTFYSTLVEKCKTAKKRITLASLYLGTGELETKLVKVIEEVVQANKGEIEVTILLDFMRGSRGKQNSRTMLEPLLNLKYGHCCQVFLYHTPKLRGFLKTVIPDRFNELIGLQHMKLYMIDNDIIISGANLSNDYFTNRQDRYFLIEDCEDLCNFYDKLVQKVGEFSFSLQKDGSTVVNSASLHPLKCSRRKFIDKAAYKIRALFATEMEKRVEPNESEKSTCSKNLNTDTWILPLVQMGQLNIEHDSKITLKLLKTAPPAAVLRLATGYFNLTADYRDAVLRDCQASCQLLTAHPTANGFFSAQGVAGGIPAAYTRIEELFCKRCDRLGQRERVTLWEFVKPGWTYHAKGLWYNLPGHSKPSLTLIGSPNFGYRSVKRDLETQVVIMTRNEKLQSALEEEHKRLFSSAHPVNRRTFRQQDRIPPAWVCAAVLFFRYYF